MPNGILESTTSPVDRATILLSKMLLFAALAWTVHVIDPMNSWVIDAVAIICLALALNQIIEHANTPRLSDIAEGREHKERRFVLVCMFAISLLLIAVAPHAPDVRSDFAEQQGYAVFVLFPAFLWVVWLIAQGSDGLIHMGRLDAEREAAAAGYIKKGYDQRDMQKNLLWLKLAIGQVLGVPVILFAPDAGKLGVINAEVLGAIIVQACIGLYWRGKFRGRNRDLYHAPQQNIEH